MALSAQNKADIIWYLGYSAKTLISGSTSYDPVVVGRLASLSAESETQLTTLIDRIEKLRLKFDKSTNRMLVKKVGDIELNPDEHSLLKKEYKRLLRELASLIDIPLLGQGSLNVSLCI